MIINKINMYYNSTGTLKPFYKNNKKISPAGIHNSTVEKEKPKSLFKRIFDKTLSLIKSNWNFLKYELFGINKNSNI